MTFALTWDAPTSCPDAAHVNRANAAWVEPAGAAASAPPVEVQATVRPSEGGWKLELNLVAAGGSERQTLVAARWSTTTVAPSRVVRSTGRVARARTPTRALQEAVPMRVALALGVVGILVGCGTATSSSGTGGGELTGNAEGGANGGSSGTGSGGGSASSSGSGSSGGLTSGSSGSGSGGGHVSDGGSSSSGGPGGDGGTYSASPVIPAASGTCPTIATGTITVSGQSVSIWAGSKGSTPAPVLFYWHGTGSTAMEAQYLMGSEITEITSAGGVVASFSTSTATGTNTGDAVWYTGDFAMADQILACAVAQLNIDTRRVYTAGCSAGGLQAGAMVFSRSAYLAASMPNSGGETFAGAYALEAPGHVPTLITTHGGSTDEVTYNGYMVSFATTSATLDSDVVGKGGFAVDCNHGGGHCGAPADDIAAQWRFCKDHPFGASPEPYAGGLPSGFPSYCTIIK